MSTPSEASTPHSEDHRSADVQSLRMLLHGLLAAVLVASIGLNVFLFKQLRLIRSANAAAVPQFEAAVKAFNEGEAVKTKALINQLRVFAKTNPDFAEILKKYGITDNAAAGAVSPAPGNK